MGAFKSAAVGAIAIEHPVGTITLSDSTHATVEGEVVTGVNREPYQWKFEKRDGKWIIVETTYKQTSTP